MAKIEPSKDPRIRFPFILRELAKSEGSGYIAHHPLFHGTYTGTGETEEEAIVSLQHCIEVADELMLAKQNI